MRPVCLEIGSITIHWFGVMMACGFLAGLANWTVLGRGRGRPFNFCTDLLFWIMVSGIVGARLTYVLANFKDYAAEPIRIFYVQEGGLIYYGGLLCVLAAITVFARVRNQGYLDLFDFVSTSVPLAHAFGRVGCFLNGCCHGAVWHGPLSVRYPADTLPWWHQVAEGAVTRFAGQSLPVHPVQLYESAFNLLLFALLAWVYRRAHRAGFVAALYLLAYPLGRFALEWLRGDPRMQGLVLPVAQEASIVLFAAGCVMMFWIHRKPRP